MTAEESQSEAMLSEAMQQVQVPSHAPAKQKGQTTPKAPAPTPSQASTSAGPIASGGGKEFQEALRTYKIKPVTTRQIGTLAPRTPETEALPSYLATVPATADTDFDTLIDRYVEAFEQGTAPGRFALVIGVNGFERPGSEQRIRDAVTRIADRPLPFPVTVIGFTWHNSKVGPNGPDQRTIPYAAIRETIVRHPDTEGALKALVDQGNGTPTFLHTGDADVQSMTGLFNRTDAIVTENPDAQLFSGGYRFPAATDANAVLANQRDQAVRDGMAKADPRAVYYPEPNTLIRVSDAMPRLDNEITFGVRPKDGTGLKYTSMEGRGLAESVFSRRKDFAAPGKIAVYSSELAVTTESDRLLQKYDPAELDGIPQSHADRKTWRDQMTRYLTEYHPDVKLDVLDSAEAIAFRSVSEISAADLAKAQAAVKKVHPREAAQHLWGLAGRTHQALNANPIPVAQTPSPAPDRRPVQAVDSPVQAVEGPKITARAAEWQRAYDNAPPRFLRTERFVPSARLTLNSTGGKLRGEVTTIDFQVREFETPDGTKVRAYDVHLDLVSRQDTVSPADRAAYAARVQNTIDTMINGRHTFNDGHQLHINLTYDTPSWTPGMLRDWQDDPGRRPPVEITLDPDADMHQHQWRAGDNPALGVHEVMHYLGLKEGNASSERLFRSTDQPGVMGNDALDLSDDDTHPYLTPADLTLLSDIAPQAGPVRSVSWAQALADSAFRSVESPSAVRQAEIAKIFREIQQNRGKTEARELSSFAQVTHQELLAHPFSAADDASQAPSHAPKTAKAEPAQAVPAAASTSAGPVTTSGGKDFKDALRNFRIRQVTTRKVGALPPRTAETQGKPSYLATVPATVDTDLNALIDRYA
ncbi:MAG TPA: hypothetical protein VFG35_22190, partial [Actinoplanes sp.]|nr:hypothetical protein [Actinoplanes sp.]